MQHSSLYDVALVYFLVFIRVGAFSFLLPVYGSVLVSVRIKLIASLSFTLFSAPLVARGVIDLNAVPSIFVGELTAGLAIGFCCRIGVWMIETAGNISSQAVTLSQPFGIQNEVAQPIVSRVLLWAALAVSVSLGLPIFLAKMIVQSYEFMPLGGLLAVDFFQETVISLFSISFQAAFALSLPFIIVSVLYNACLGVLNRAMPQLMVAFVGAPAIMFLAIFFLLISGPFIISSWSDDFVGYFDAFGI